MAVIFAIYCKFFTVKNCNFLNYSTVEIDKEQRLKIESGIKTNMFLFRGKKSLKWCLFLELTGNFSPGDLSAIFAIFACVNRSIKKMAAPEKIGLQSRNTHRDRSSKDFPFSLKNLNVSLEFQQF